MYMEKESYKTKYNRYYMRDYYKKNKDNLNQQRLISYYRTRYGLEDEEDIRKFKEHSRCYRTLMKFSDQEIADARAGKECHWRLQDVIDTVCDLDEGLVARLRAKVADC